METNTLAEWYMSTCGLTIRKIPADALEVEVVDVPEGAFNFARCNLKCKVVMTFETTQHERWIDMQVTTYGISYFHCS